MNVQLQVNLKLLNPARLHKTNSVKYRLYSPTAMTNAYMAVKKQNMSVRKAARQFSIPRQTLRDRTTGQIDADCNYRPSPCTKYGRRGKAGGSSKNYGILWLRIHSVRK